MKNFSSSHPLNNIEITYYFKYEPRCNGVFSTNNLPRIKDGAYVINLDDKNSKGTHWISLFINKNTAVYFYSFEIEYIPQEILNKIWITIYIKYKIMNLLCVDFIVSLS